MPLCFRQSEDPEREKLSLAQHRAQEASKMRDNPRKMREEFLYAAEQYLDCGHRVEAGACLQNAREHLLVSGLWEKLGQVLTPSVYD